MVYLGLFDKESLRKLIINRIINEELEQLTAIKNEDKWDIFTYLNNVTNYNIEVKSSYYFWKSQYYEYCIDSETEYNDGLEQEDKLNNYELNDIIERKFEDKDQFNDYLDLVKDHLDIFEDKKEICF